MFYYSTSMDTISLSCTVFEIFDFKVFRFDFDLWNQKVIWGQKNYTIREPIYDILFDLYGHHLSSSYRSRDIRLQSF